MIHEEILNLSKQVKDILDNKHERAIASLVVFVLGSYGEDKDYIESLRNKLANRRIKAFLMEDIKSDESNFKIKFDAIWGSMRKFSNPLFILFAGDSAPLSHGFISELVTIAEDREKLDVAHLFKINKIQLPHHEKVYYNCHNIKDGEEFVERALILIERKIENIKNFLEVLD